MTWPVNLYPERLFSRGQLRLKFRRGGGRVERLVWVMRRKRAAAPMIEMLRRAA
jgi:hypothetical protein